MVSDFRKNRSKHIFSRILFACGIVLVSVVAVLLVIADVKIYQKRKQLNAQIENLKSKIQELENQNNSLKQGVSNADNDAYIEKIAREELNLQKPGEKVISFVAAEKELEQNNEKKGLLQIWLDWLGGIFKK